MKQIIYEILSKFYNDLLNKYSDDKFKGSFITNFCNLLKECIDDNILEFRVLYTLEKFGESFLNYVKNHGEKEFFFIFILLLIKNEEDEYYNNNILNAYTNKYGEINLWHLSSEKLRTIKQILLNNLKFFINDSIENYLIDN